jgi:hypothetical protein
VTGPRLRVCQLSRSPTEPALLVQRPKRGDAPTPPPVEYLRVLGPSCTVPPTHQRTGAVLAADHLDMSLVTGGPEPGKPRDGIRL